MHKLIASGVVAVSLFGASIASAQSYYSFYGNTTTSAGACVRLSSNLSFGSRAAEVSQLQRFLASQDYPGGGSWMVTGYFGQATTQAVRNFQQSVGLSSTGVVEASTRAAIERASCGGQSNAYIFNQPYLPTGQAGTYTYDYNKQNNYYSSDPYSYNYGYNYNTSPFAQSYGGTQYTYGNSCGTYPYYYACNNTSVSPTITSLSTTNATPGSVVTIFGTGFDYSSNTVYVGGTTLSGIASQNGTSLVFTVPSIASGSVSVTVANSRGTSNALTLSLPGTLYPPSVYSGYPYGNYGQTYCQGATPTISYISPNIGAIGTSVTVYGTCFSGTGNAVRFGNGIIANLASYDGRTVSFTVPSSLSGYGFQPIGLGTYNVSVSNSWGTSSNTMPFTITSLGSAVAPTITSVNGPTTLQTGLSGLWSITVNNPSGAYLTTSITWGDEGTYGYQAAAAQTTSVVNQSTQTFTHTYYTAGTYTVTFRVSNQNGQQNVSSATVTVSNSNTNTGSVTLSSISPTSGRVGTQIMLQGTGFSALDNTVYFGIGGTLHLPSFNGTTIYYTVPQYVSPCDVTVTGGFCAQNIQQIMAGPVQVRVGNSNGTTNTLMFQVR